MSFCFSFGMHIVSQQEMFLILCSCLIFFQCSPDYAYGSAGFAAWGIKPHSVLVFEIEVLRAE